MHKMKMACLAALFSLALPSLSFSMSSDGIMGPQLIGSDGGARTVRVGKDGTLVTQDGHGKYQEPAYRGALWTCSNAAGTAVTTKAGLDAAAPALTLYNPTNSGKALVLLEDSVEFTAAPAAAAGVMLAFNVASSTAGPTTTTAGNVQNANLGLVTTPTASCYRVATLVTTPVAFRYVGGTTGAAAISGLSLVDNVDGKIVIPPGVAVSIQTTSAAAIIGHFMWEEINYP